MNSVTGAQLRDERLRRGWTETQAAARLDVSQPYLSLLEKGKRRVTERLARRARAVYRLGPESLPLGETSDWNRTLGPEVLFRELAGLGYPGYAAAGGTARWNPTELLLRALAQDDLEPRTVEALPWVLLSFNVDWDWLLPRVKMVDAQNRLGFLLQVAGLVARSSGYSDSAKQLAEVESRLEGSRLSADDKFRRASMTNAEARWLLSNRPQAAVRWNMLSDLKPEHLQYVK